MAHSVRVGFLSGTGRASEMVDAILDKSVISAKNIFVSDHDDARKAKYAGQGVTVLKDDAATLVKSEIAVLTADKKSFGTVLAPLSAVTRGKILIAMTEGVDVAAVQQWVAKGTLVVASGLQTQEDGSQTVQLSYSAGFPDYLKSACVDLINCVCGQSIP